MFAVRKLFLFVSAHIVFYRIVPFFFNRRSLTPTGSTILNMDSQEFDERSGKADAILRLFAMGEDAGVIYPRYQEFKNSRLGGENLQTGPTKLPTLDEMEAIILQAQRDAESDLNNLGKI